MTSTIHPSGTRVTAPPAAPPPEPLYTKADLVAALAGLGLETTGTKADLAERLAAHNTEAPR